MRAISRPAVLLAGVLAAVLSATSPALANGLHWFQGQDPTVVVTDNDTASPTVSASGEVAGAGDYITAWLTVDYTYSSTCDNPGQDTGPVPGQSGTGTFTAPEQQIEAVHGNASFRLPETGAYTIAPSGGCPNSSWTSHVSVTITSVTVHVTSSNGGSLDYTAYSPF